MHEVSHNMGLMHSSKGTIEYGDESGVMGFTDDLEDDMKCFNAVKSWQLGWYADGHETINPLEAPFQGKIVGVANYDTRGNLPVIIKIIGHNDGNDYYVSFNRAAGINSGSTTGRNKVHIFSQNSTKIDDFSYVKATLLQEESFEIENFADSSFTLQISVDKISLKKGSTGFAKISISLQEIDNDKKKGNKKNKQNKKNKGKNRNKNKTRGKNKKTKRKMLR